MSPAGSSTFRDGATTASCGEASYENSSALARALQRWLIGQVLRITGNPPIGVVLPNGEEVCGAEGVPVARVSIRDRAALWKLLMHCDLHFGDLYSENRVEIEGDLLAFLEAVYRTMDGSTSGRFRWWLQGKLPSLRTNSLAGSRKNIHHHYDIGNDFYRLWLDDQLLYTCAYYPTEHATLEQAQRAKMDYVCRKIWLRPGESVVEAGCGWGGLARHMARHYGARVKALNISHEQIVYAREAARREGLDNRVEFIEDDYRNITGRFDAFVSVGMLEHVGRNHYGELGATVNRCLEKAGRGLLHSIGRDQPGEINAWIRRRIFPGAYPPTLREMTQVLEPWGFSVLDVENLRLHYAQTLRHWLDRFNAAEEEVERMFDPTFVRAWRLYLAGSLAGFTTGWLQLFQIVFTRAGLNAVPWTRSRLYIEEEPALGRPAIVAE